MRALVLDFDGVLVDSSREAHVVALRTYLALAPSSPLRRFLGPVRPGADPARHGFDSDPLYRAFHDLVPLGNRAEDFGVALAAFERGAAIADQADYDAFFAGQDPIWLDAFHHEFYRQRAALRAESLDGWLGLQRPFSPFLDLLRRRAGEVAYAIATAKDGASVRLLLDRYGAADLFAPEAVLDKETGRSKRRHLEVVHERLGVEWRELTFVDDKVNHLEAVSDLGVRPVLAAWGHNTRREHARARALGFAVAALDDAEAALFGGTDGA